MEFEISWFDRPYFDVIRGRDELKFGRYPVPISTQKFFSGRYPVPNGTQIFWNSSRYPGTRYPGTHPSQKLNQNYNFEIWGQI